MIHCLVKKGGEQVVLAGKVAVDSRAGDAQLGPDFIQCHVVKAAFQEQVSGDIQNLFVSFHAVSFSHWSLLYV